MIGTETTARATELDGSATRLRRPNSRHPLSWVTCRQPPKRATADLGWEFGAPRAHVRARFRGCAFRPRSIGALAHERRCRPGHPHAIILGRRGHHLCARAVILAPAAQLLGPWAWRIISEGAMHSIALVFEGYANTSHLGHLHFANFCLQPLLPCMQRLSKCSMDEHSPAAGARKG